MAFDERSLLIDVEPAFEQMKVAQDAGKLRVRGLGNARGQWTLQAFSHHVRNLHRDDPTAVADRLNRYRHGVLVLS